MKVYFSWDPGDNFSRDLSMHRNQWLNLSQIFHLLQFIQRLLELLAGWRVLSNHGDELNAVKFGLVQHIVQEHDDGVQFVQIVDLYLAFFDLGQRGQCTHSRSSHLWNLISQHSAKRSDRLSFECGHLANLIVRDGSETISRKASDAGVW